MNGLLDRTTLLIMASAFIAVLLCVIPPVRDMFPFWVIARGAFVGDSLFHECGHAVFAWMFGHPAIPMLFTLFGADQAAGLSLTYDFSWFVQIAAAAGLGYGCYWLRAHKPMLFIPAILFCGALIIAAVTKHQYILINYMGHGSSIAMGGFFLFRGWVYLDSRNEFERWLNAFLGFYLTLNNAYFSYTLAYDREALDNYSDHMIFGASHMDFWKMAEEIPGWTVPGIAIFTIGYCLAVIVGSFILAVLFRDDFEEG